MLGSLLEFRLDYLEGKTLVKAVTKIYFVVLFVHE